MQSARHQAGRVGRKGLPLNLSPPRTGHAAGATTRQRDVRADRQNGTGSAENAAPGARQIPVSLPGSQADDRDHRAKWTARSGGGGCSENRGQQGRTDPRLARRKVVETKMEGHKDHPAPGSEHDLPTPVVVSSIGSVPEKLSGINMNG